MQAAKERSVVDQTPRQQAVEVLAHRERADRYAQLEVTQGEPGPAGQAALTEQRVRIELPQIEREYPKHFRIATVMMKGPAKLTEIAEQSGASLGDVTDFVNAGLATGVVVPG